MAKPPFGDLLLYLRKVCGSQAARDVSDAELLERFRVHRDDIAFSVIVHRHGPMVLGVCQRVLNDSHGAEDAFQATFMVLVRQVASISCKGITGKLAVCSGSTRRHQGEEPGDDPAPPRKAVGANAHRGAAR